MPFSTIQQFQSLLTIVAKQALSEGYYETGVEPSDIVQQTYVQAYSKQAQFNGKTEAELKAWLIAILKNEVRQMQRKLIDTQKRDVRKQIALMDFHVSDYLTGAVDEQPSLRVLGKEAETVLQDTLFELSVTERTIIMLRIFDSKEFHEIAALLGIREATVRKQLERALNHWFMLYSQRGESALLG